ncbi:alpha/beta hydrolase [Xanthomonas vasicola]|uniref:Cysteine protease n=1 Tax=Xanthomonas vasicola pv. vasculorum NCPPB 890 TaxID=1184265 RepID=A0A836P4E3_XANVA|nr:alpha/beta fold hydrolase [Xanthomonas vasicola]KFA25869.1 cysteine protease [Xanthomonas vasicola pv. vasculorum NCPPB 1326]KFA27239.1 cysteine protease [Xanthomonas vasicola pv. vasculorum NCPPB 1381]MBV6746258.1 alpha/beta hydrolase [Xanthomonas vasicola pv. vasculorum NCPPB 890]MBV6891325.1 alpha/beta hydrolase [Xanthomonas vasicola pv. vasculorum]MDO6948995.1 alpha/beta fold hydrolase [Xanthomonas vasicola]
MTMVKQSTVVAAVLIAMLAAGCQRAAAPAAANDVAGKSTATAPGTTAQQPAASSPPGSAAGNRYGTLLFTPCTLSAGGAAGNIEAQCATLRVPENPAAPSGRSIALKIAWLESEAGGGSAPDPVFFIAGGPGQSATEVGAIVDMGLHEVRKQRDIFLVDQRGTGGSHPLECRDAAGKPLALDNISEATAEHLTAYAARCADGLRNDADPRYYTTSEAIGDLDAVRAALGVQSLNLIGASYGTRVAQHYAARYPQHTRTVVIDGVAPNDLVIGGEFARTFEDAIALQSAQCRQQPACAKRFPVDTATQLRQVVERLRQAPVTVDYSDPRTGALRHEQVTADTVAGLAFGFSYAPETASLLPLVLDEAAAGRYASLMALAQMSASGMSDQMNRLMQWSVLCSEDAGRYHAPDQKEATLLGNEVAEMFFAPCKVWPSKPAPAAASAPFRSTLPVLLLSGQLDPVTPPRYAERVLQGLPNGRHVIAPGQGHGVFRLGCMPKVLSQFMQTADVKTLDTTCVASLNTVPAFTSFNGWEP